MKFRLLSPSDKIDLVLSSAAFIQPLLVLMQLVMIAEGWNEDDTTIYRVILSAICVLCAFPFVLKRNALLVIITYFVAITILLLEYVGFPNNQDYIYQESLRFTLPIVIPAALFIAMVKNTKMFFTVLYYICWCIGLVGVWWALGMLSGRYLFSSYSMSYGYSLLLPSMFLFIQKNWYSKLMAIVLFVLILVFGSRGASLAFVAFLLSFTLRDRKYRVLIVLLSIVGLALLPWFLDFLNKYGVSSRTLLMLTGGSIDSDSGRGDLQQIVLNELKNHPILGLGLWGDRSVIGIYCHNVILEIIVNFGFFLGGMFLLWFLLFVIKLFLRLNKEGKNILILFSIYTIVPLMFSGSYLTDVTVGLYVGILVLLSKYYRRERSICIRNKSLE